MVENFGEYNFSPQSKEPQITIEGKVETAFHEIQPMDSIIVPLPATIAWDDAQLRFEPVTNYLMPLRFTSGVNIDLYYGYLDFINHDNTPATADISTLTNSKFPVLYTGTANGFYAHDPRVMSRSKRDYPFYVVGVQPSELEESKAELAAVWHENGHIGIMHSGCDARLLQSAVDYKTPLAAVSRIEKYFDYLDERIPSKMRDQLTGTTINPQILNKATNKNYQVGRAISLFHERNAWAGGAKLAREKGLPLGFQQNTSFITYAQLCLATYARSYNEDRFVNGWR